MKHLTLFTLIACLAASGQNRLLDPEAAQAAKAEARADAEYDRAMKALDERRFAEVAKMMADIAAQKGDKSDGAMYWKAYSEAKLGETKAALDSLMALQKAYANSRWINDAKALAMEIKQASGEKLSPEQAADEDLKLMAINSLMQSDPDRALPALEKVLKSSASLKLKERAMFVLAQSNSAKARELLASIAKGQTNPELQRRAIRNLAIAGGPDSKKLMAEIYAGADVSVKKEIIHGCLVSGDKATLVSLAKTEKTPELRMEAIHTLGAMGEPGALAEMYATETELNVKKAILHGLFVSGAADKLAEIAKTEKDPKLQAEAIRDIGLAGKSDLLPGFYKNSTDPAVRKAALEGMFISGNSKGLLELARQEKDPVMKREIVQKLSLMGSKETTEFMLELLNK